MEYDFARSCNLVSVGIWCEWKIQTSGGLRFSANWIICEISPRCINFCKTLAILVWIEASKGGSVIVVEELEDIGFDDGILDVGFNSITVLINVSKLWFCLNVNRAVPTVLAWLVKYILLAITPISLNTFLYLVLFPIECSTEAKIRELINVVKGIN